MSACRDRLPEGAPLSRDADADGGNGWTDRPAPRDLALARLNHIEHWAQGGATALGNLVLLCRRHHRAVHEEGFRVALDAAGEARFARPDGRPLPEAPALPADHRRAAGAGDGAARPGGHPHRPAHGHPGLAGRAARRRLGRRRTVAAPRGRRGRRAVRGAVGAGSSQPNNPTSLPCDGRGAGPVNLARSRTDPRPPPPARPCTAAGRAARARSTG